MFERPVRTASLIFGMAFALSACISVYEVAIASAKLESQAVDYSDQRVAMSEGQTAIGKVLLLKGKLVGISSHSGQPYLQVQSNQNYWYVYYSQEQAAEVRAADDSKKLSSVKVLCRISGDYSCHLL